jgi:hypothetical protein
MSLNILLPITKEPTEEINCGFTNTPYLSKELQEKIKGVIEEWLLKV